MNFESEFTRQLKIVLKGQSVILDAKLWIGDLRRDNIGWVCHYSIEHIRPNPFPIGGPDPMGAVYHCMNFVEGVIRQLEDQGYQVWFEKVGDHGGFYSITRHGCRPNKALQLTPSRPPATLYDRFPIPFMPRPTSNARSG